MRIKYQKQGNYTFPVIWRKKGNQETDRCPFCARKHIHGSVEGHRLTHCSSDANHFYEVDGYKFDRQWGYILLEYE